MEKKEWDRQIPARKMAQSLPPPPARTASSLPPGALLRRHLQRSASHELCLSHVPQRIVMPEKEPRTARIKA